MPKITEKPTKSKPKAKAVMMAEEKAEKLKAAAEAAEEAKAAAKAEAEAPAPVEEAAPAEVAAEATGEAAALFEAPEGDADDLKLISGVGPKLEKTLNGLGFWHFSQIAKWTKADVAVVDSELTFKGRIERDDWIKQAKALAKGR